MKYALMFVDSVDAIDAWKDLPKDQVAAGWDQVNKWFDEHAKAGRIVSTEGLGSPSSATTVRFKNGKPVVTDGPFIESKEIIGGYAIVEVKDLDEALAMAKTWPGGSPERSVEVRPVVEAPKG